VSILGGKFVNETGIRNGAFGADKFGFQKLAAVHWNHTAPALYEFSIANDEAQVVEGGAICAETGVHTGRSPKDKHTVVDHHTENSVWWEGNRTISQEQFQLLYDDFIEHAKGKELFAQDLYGGAAPKPGKKPVKGRGGSRVPGARPGSFWEASS
jgi:phosphoenolpyruvate carboxykinase (ATP)